MTLLITQPVMGASEIARIRTVRQLYGRRLLAAGVVTQVDLDGMAGALNAQLEKAKAYAEAVKPSDAPPPVHGPWAAYSKRMPKDAKGLAACARRWTRGNAQEYVCGNFSRFRKDSQSIRSSNV